MNEGLYLLDFLPAGIDKSDPVIQAVFSNSEGEGAIANEIEELLRFIRYYAMTPNVRDHSGYTLEMVTQLFAKIKRQLMETDDRLLRRMLALTARSGDTVWGNATDIERVFEYYFTSIKAYICENTNADSLIADGSFEEADSWRLTGGAEYTDEARFSGERGLFFDGTQGSCSQPTAYLLQGVYVLHFFLAGKCGVKIQDSLGRYWNAKAEPDRYALRWETAEVINSFETPAWKDVYCFIVLPNISALTITFISLDGEEASIDYVRLFQKPLNPSYTLIIQYKGYKITPRTLHLGARCSDPIADVDYAKESYFDRSYIIGRLGSYRGTVYKTLLDAVRPRGVQAFIEFVEKSELVNS
jgi:hypothetical protein